MQNGSLSMYETVGSDFVRAAFLNRRDQKT